LEGENSDLKEEEFLNEQTTSQKDLECATESRLFTKAMKFSFFLCKITFLAK